MAPPPNADAWPTQDGGVLDFNDAPEQDVHKVARIERPAGEAVAPSSGKPPWLQAMPETVAAAPAAEDVQPAGEIEDDPIAREDDYCPDTYVAHDEPVPPDADAAPSWSPPSTTGAPSAEPPRTDTNTGSATPRGRYAQTDAIKQAVRGRGSEVLHALKVSWPPARGDHVLCPYPSHKDHDPSWRWDEQKGCAFCTCESGLSIFDVVMRVEGIDFEAAKIRVAEILNRHDLTIDPSAEHGVTVQEMAVARKPPEDFLREQGWRDLPKSGKYHNRAAIAISYTDSQNRNLWLRIRVKPSGKNKDRWRKGDADKHGPAPLYGAHMARHLPTAGYGLIVEGETDSVTCWHNGFPALGLPGAGNWNEEAHAPLFEGVPTIFVVIERDKGGASVLKWLSRSSIAPRVRLVYMPEGVKDPSELWCRNPDRDAFRAAMQACLDAAEPFDPEKYAPNKATAGATGEVTINDFWSCLPQGDYIFVPTGQHWPRKSVNAAADVEEAAALLDIHRAVHQMTWAPGLEQIISGRLMVDGGWIERAGVNCYNKYIPPQIELGDPSDIKPWLDHVRLLYPDDADHIVKWFAQRVQHPEVKINHVLLLGGPPGIGKDTILEPVKYAIGEWNFQEVSASQVGGRFNGFLKAVMLRISEARDFGDLNRYQFYDHLKIYAASPPDVLRVDEKNTKEYPILNVVGVIITTNYKTDGVFLPADDRRHYVAWSDVVKEDARLRGDYFKNLYAWFDAGGKNNVAAYLAGLDLTGFDPKAPPPKTPAFWAIADANEPEEELELADILDALVRPRCVTIPELINSAPRKETADWLSDRRNSRSIPKRMAKCGYEPVRNSDAEDGRWVIRGRRLVVYALASMPPAARSETVRAYVRDRNP